jgi:prepilin-type N-terminal cleavage/methylation domain-containing protein
VKLVVNSAAKTVLPTQKQNNVRRRMSEVSCRGGCLSRIPPSPQRGFTLIELLVVMAIIGILMVLIVPAFTTIKSGTDLTTAANTIKGVLDTARTYAKANNTYTWVGFFEEDVSQPWHPSTSLTPTGIGRIIMSIVASKDGTNVGSVGSTIDPTKVIQVGTLTKIDNVHLAAFTDGSGTYPGTTFPTRPPVTFNGVQYSLVNLPLSTALFQYPLSGTAQYNFVMAVQFSSGGETRIDNNIYAAQTAAEVGLEPTHGAVVPASLPADIVAIQFTGEGGAVTIYRK